MNDSDPMSITSPFAEVKDLKKNVSTASVIGTCPPAKRKEILAETKNLIA